MAQVARTEPTLESQVDQDAVIRLRGLVNRFGSQTVHDGLDLDVRKGEVLGVVGGSGTGKSVLMRTIIGLRDPQAGTIEVLGRDTRSLNTAQAKELRSHWGVLFQDGALFSSLTVAQNIEVPMKEHLGMPPRLRDEIAALKIAMAYHRARGEGQRTRFVSRERAYHGVNIGGTSLSGMVKNRETFSGFMPGIVHMRHTWLEENRFAKGQPEHGAYLADDLQRAAENYGGGTIAACFVEPIAGSTGVLVPPVGYLERLREICDAHGILLVFDEVICGFGRTGKAFAAQSFGVVPDIITMAKALTNGAVPMAAVAVRDEIYDTVVGASPDGAIEMFHGYTYSGHPVACAAGLATLDIYEKENLFERAAELSPYFLDQMHSLGDMGVVTDIRGYGLIAGIDVAAGDAPGKRGTQLQKDLFWSGLHVKFTGDTGIVAPPFIAESVTDPEPSVGAVKSGAGSPFVKFIMLNS